MRLYTGRLLEIARRLSRTETEARAAVQDAFAAVRRTGHQLGDEPSALARLRRLVVNAVTRRQGNLCATSLETLLPVLTADGRLDSDRLSWPATEDQLADPRRIRRGIDQLPYECRAVLLLRDGEGLDYATIAWTLETTEGAVRQNRQRAHMALRELVARELPTPNERHDAAAGVGAATATPV